MKKILGAEPFYFNQEKEIIKKIGEIIISGQLSSGKFVKMFEKKFSDFFGSKYSIAVNSGGTGLELALEALNIKGKEVLMPTQTFIATPNSVVRAGGKPIFCDIDRNTGCLNPDDILRKKRDFKKKTRF